MAQTSIRCSLSITHVLRSRINALTTIPAQNQRTPAVIMSMSDISFNGTEPHILELRSGRNDPLSWGMTAVDLDFSAYMEGKGEDSLHRLLDFLENDLDVQGGPQRVGRIADMVLDIWEGPQAKAREHPVQKLKTVCEDHRKNLVCDSHPEAGEEPQRKQHQKFNEGAIQLMFGAHCFLMNLHFQKKEPKEFFQASHNRSCLSNSLRYNVLSVEEKHFDVRSFETVIAKEKGLFPLKDLIDWKGTVPNGYELVNAQLSKLAQVARQNKEQDRVDLFYKSSSIGELCQHYNKLIAACAKNAKEKEGCLEFAKLLLCPYRSTPFFLAVEDKVKAWGGDAFDMISIFKKELVKTNTNTIYTVKVAVEQWIDWHFVVNDIILSQIQLLTFKMWFAYNKDDRASFDVNNQLRDNWLKVAIATGFKEESLLKELRRCDGNAFPRFLRA